MQIGLPLGLVPTSDAIGSGVGSKKTCVLVQINNKTESESESESEGSEGFLFSDSTYSCVASGNRKPVLMGFAIL